MGLLGSLSIPIFGSKLKVYSAHEISIVFAGIPLDSGRGDAEFCSIAKDDQAFTYRAGIYGEGTRVESLNTYHRVTLTLMRTSTGNAYLAAIHAGDVGNVGGQGIANLLIKDRQGISVFETMEAWIEKTPDQAYAKEANTVQWVLGAHGPSNFIGGN